MYLLKGLVSSLATPLTLALLVTAVAVMLRLAGRVRPARYLFVGAAVIAYLGSISLAGDALIGPLERRFPPLRLDGSIPDVEYVVVLGSGYAPRDGLPVTAALDPDGLVRIVEGIRLMQRFESAKLVASGGAPPQALPPARGYDVLARELGVDERSVVILDKALDTAGEARAVAALVGNAPFILVTSAYHMPRAVMQMRHAGANPIPAPTGQLARGSAPADWRGLLPSSGGLRKIERALHEYLGMAAMAVGLG